MLVATLIQAAHITWHLAKSHNTLVVKLQCSSIPGDDQPACWEPTKGLVTWGLSCLELYYFVSTSVSWVARCKPMRIQDVYWQAAFSLCDCTVPSGFCVFFVHKTPQQVVEACIRYRILAWTACYLAAMLAAEHGVMKSCKHRDLLILAPTCMSGIMLSFSLCKRTALCLRSYVCSMAYQTHFF